MNVAHWHVYISSSGSILDLNDCCVIKADTRLCVLHICARTNSVHVATDDSEGEFDQEKHRRTMRETMHIVIDGSGTYIFLYTYENADFSFR